MAHRAPSSPTFMPTILRYGIAVLSAAIAIGLDFILLRHFEAVLTPFLFAVAATVWYAGTGPGILAIVLSVLSLNYFFLRPFSFSPISYADLVYLTFCTFCALAVGWVSAVRRQAEQELRQAREELEAKVVERTANFQRSESYLTETQKLTHTGSWAWDVRSQKVLYCSEEMFRIYGLDPQIDLPTRKNFRQRVHPEDRNRVDERFARVVNEKVDSFDEYRIVLPDGTVKHVNSSGHPVLDEKGQLIEFIGTATDITERKCAEEALRESEDKLRQIMDTVPGLTWSTGFDGSDGKKSEVQPRFVAQVQAILDVLPTYTWYSAPSGGLTFVNRRTAEYLGVPKDHPLRFGIDIGAQWDDWVPLLHPDDQEEARKYWSNLLRTGEGGEHSYRVRSAQGNYRWFLTRIEPLRASDGTLLLWFGATLDIEELKRAEQAQRELVEQQTAVSEVLRAIANSPHDLQPIFDAILDSAKRLCRADMGSLRLFEESGLRLVGVRGDPFLVNQVWSSFPVLDKESFLGQLATSKLPAHIPDLTALEGNHRDDLWVAAAKARHRTALFVPLLKDNEIVGVISLGRTRVQPFTDKQISLFTDFAAQASIALESTRRERQYREMQSELAHANRVATMGQLTASITHEVNQPITAAVTYALAARRFLSAEPPNFQEVDDALSLIVKEGNRAGEVVGRIRALIKKAPPRKDAVQINDAISEVIALTRTEAANNSVSVRTQLADGLPDVQGDRVQLQQVLLNLIINAIEAMRGVGEEKRELLISTSNEPDGVSVEVRDSGPSFAPAAFERVFEAFYTTKPGGLGLGLSICRSIIEAHSGRLWASPNVPHGAIFGFLAPAHSLVASNSVGDGVECAEADNSAHVPPSR
jgi:PAS domain S-box-containing protein